MLIGKLEGFFTYGSHGITVHFSPLKLIFYFPMGQRDILKTLYNKGWLTKREIAEILGRNNPSSVNKNLKRLVKAGFVETKEHPNMKNGYLYRLSDKINNAQDDDGE